MHPLLKNLCRSMQEMFFPSRCLVCGAVFHFQDSVHPSGEASDAAPVSRSGRRHGGSISEPAGDPDFAHWMAPFLCGACSRGFRPVRSPLCPVCGVMFESRSGTDHLCGPCLDSPRSFRIARAGGVYGPPLSIVMHRFKYGGKIQLARPLSRLLRSAFYRFWEKGGIDLAMPVPLHPARFRKRGFNPAYLLVKEWAGLFPGELNGPDGPRIERRVLEKHRPTPPQTGLERKVRTGNVKNAFRVTGDAEIAGQRILLVDDVFTTGSTAGECARVLLAGGARHVDVLTLARAV